MDQPFHAPARPAGSVRHPYGIDPRSARGGDVVGRLRRAEAEVFRLRLCLLHLGRLRQAGLLAGGMAHEAKNLLSGIAGTSHVALLSTDAAQWRKSLERIDALSRRAAETMQAFLAFSCPATSGGSGEDRDACVLSDVLEDLRRFVEASPDAVGARLSTHVPSGLAVAGDRSLVLQALLNVVLNGCQAVRHRAGSVRLEAHAEGTQVSITVSDDGPGVPREVQAHLFEPFPNGSAGVAAAKASTAASAVGSGLGLYVTRLIVERMGGAVAHIANAPAGAVFRVRLPRAPTIPSGARADSAA